MQWKPEFASAAIPEFFDGSIVVTAEGGEKGAYSFKKLVYD